MGRISKADKLELKRLQQKYSMDQIKKIRGYIFQGYNINEAIRKVTHD